MYLSKGTYILKKTGNKPDFTKQPYFKRLLFELWLSEPDYKLGLDEEIISSLESIHDELYFDTLDFIRGITEIELEDESLAEDSSRYSAPGNILPLIHPSIEGQPGRVKVTLEDWQLKEQGVLETPFIFPCLKSLILSLKFEDLVKEEMFPVFPGEMDPGITPPENDPSTPITPSIQVVQSS